MRIITLIGLILFFVNVGLAQSSSEVGLFLGGTNYYGEVAKDHGSAEEIGLAAGIMGRYMLNRTMGLKGIAGLVKLKGKDITSGIHVERNWEIENDLVELSVQFEYFPAGKGRRNFVGRFNQYRLSPYFFFGGGVAIGTPKVFVPERDKDLFPESENQPDNFVILPIGGGLRFDLNQYCILSVEFGKRMVFSDYLDGISINGDSTTNDWYAFGGLMISILLNAQTDRRF